MANLQLMPGSLFANRFEILHAAGSGGMGTVYCANDLYSNDLVALKLLHADSGECDQGERFAREAQLLSELRHPGIVAHVAHGQTPDGQRFLAMEWLSGHDLGQRLRRGALSVPDSVRLISHVANALALAHQHGVIHRDLKPANLFLVNGDVDRVKVLDFGIARRIANSQTMTRTGMVIGTPEYMAPEQARGSTNLTPAADLFSLGCLLYECLAGRPPFVADHVAAVLVKILFEEPAPLAERLPAVPAALAALVERLLAKDPTRRPADAAALHAELSALAEQPQPDLAVTLSSPHALRVEPFAEHEQSLCSIVLAAPSPEYLEQDERARGSAPLLSDAAIHRQLATLGGAADALADGTLVVTMPPLISAQDQAVMAAEAALVIKERWPSAVVAMATGRGMIHGRTKVGEVVELAAQLLNRGSLHPGGAPPGGVLIDELSAKLLEGRLMLTPQPDGMLLLQKARQDDASRTLLGRPTPYVGRDAELGTLESQLVGCIDESEARVVLITAPPGMGKSRLRLEFLRQVAKRHERVTILQGRADMIKAGIPYEILGSAIRRFIGLTGGESLAVQQQRLCTQVSETVQPASQERLRLFLGELCNIRFSDEGTPMLQAARQDPKIMRDRVLRALLDWLAALCAAGPVLLCLDDLQWGDALTAAALDQALYEQAAAPLLIVAFARPEVHQALPELWQAHNRQELHLKALSKKACERLIRQVLGNQVQEEPLARAVEQSGGNALFLEELIRSIAEGKSTEQPQTVLAMLQARIGRLDSGPRRALRAAAVFGQTFWLGGVADLLGLKRSSDDVLRWLAAAVRAELIQTHSGSRYPGEKEFGFRHALVCDAAYGLLTSADLASGHRLAGIFLESVMEGNPAIIAEHFDRSGDKQQASRCYLAAAAKLIDRGDNQGALRCVERGLRGEPDAMLLAHLRSIESLACTWLGRSERSEESSVTALAQLPAGSLGWCRAMLAAFFAARYRQDVARGQQLVSLILTTDPEPDARAVFIQILAVLHASLQQSAPLTALQAINQKLNHAVVQAESTNPTLRSVSYLANAGLVLFRQPRPWTAISICQPAFALIEQAGDERLYLAACSTLDFAWLELGDVDGVVMRLSALATRIARSQDALIGILWRFLLARALCEQDNEDAYRRAEELMGPVAAPVGGHIAHIIFCQAITARLALQRGQLVEAAAISRAAMQHFAFLPIHLSQVAAVQIQALRELGNPAAAVAVAQQVLAAIAYLGGLGFSEIEFRLAASLAFYDSGHRDRANAELAETLRQIHLRADDITDARWRERFLTRNRYCVRARKLARDWGLADVLP